jgi:hypothetical protein
MNSISQVHRYCQKGDHEQRHKCEKYLWTHNVFTGSDNHNRKDQPHDYVREEKVGK